MSGDVLNTHPGTSCTVSERPAQSPDVLLERPRTYFRDVLRANVAERIWGILPQGGGECMPKSATLFAKKLVPKAIPIPQSSVWGLVKTLSLLFMYLTFVKTLSYFGTPSG